MSTDSTVSVISIGGEGAIDVFIVSCGEVFALSLELHPSSIIITVAEIKLFNTNLWVFIIRVLLVIYTVSFILWK